MGALMDGPADQIDPRYVSPVSGKRFTPIHMPLFWEDGTPTFKLADVTDRPDAMHAQLRRVLAAAEETEVGRVHSYYFR